MSFVAISPCRISLLQGHVACRNFILTWPYVMLLSFFKANFHFNLIIVSSDSQHPTLVITLWEYPTDHLIQV